MQSYQLDLLDEKALVILRGLEQLRIISLKPLKEEELVSDHKKNRPTTAERSTTSLETRLSNFKKLRGTIDLGLSRQVIDSEIDKMREGWH